MAAASYVDSHTRPGKGRSYDHVYDSDPWHRYMWSTEQRILDAILRRYFPDGRADLLDFACGTGRIASVLESRVATSTGVDVSESMLEVAREKLRRTTLLNANLLRDDVLDGRRFDLITAFRFFVNAEGELRRSAMRVLASHLADDGILVFNNHQNAGALFTRVTRAYAGWKGVERANALSIDDCRTLLGEVGLIIDRIYPAGAIRFPRVPLPTPAYRAADALAARWSWLARRSESPVLVARRKAGS